jgi:hypothetical protein
LYNINILILAIRWVNKIEIEYIRKLITINEHASREFSINGYFKINNIIESDHINEFIESVQDVQGYDSQVASQGNLIQSNEPKSSFISYSITSDLIFSQIEKLFAKFDKYKIKLIQNSFPLFDLNLYSVNFYKTKASNIKRNLHYVQKYHRDYDGFNCYVLFLILSDVSKDNGATILKDNLGNLHYLEGKKGDAYIMDPFLMHRANESLLNDRYVMWIRFGEIPNLAYLQDLSFLMDVNKRLNLLNIQFQKLLNE